MTVYCEDLICETHGEGDILNLADARVTVIQRSGISDGVVTLYVYGSTAALTTIE
jgi:thiamine phosphate synthase YjbQ (UPF0047 family)